MGNQTDKQSESKAIVDIGGFALLEVVDINPIGAFLDWGLEKNLLLPFAEQTRDLRPGDDVFVGVYLDNTGRPCATMKTDSLLKALIIDMNGLAENLKVGEPVVVIVCGKTELGYKAIIKDSYLGLIFNNEVFAELRLGQKVQAYIKKIRSDGKIDLILSGEGLAGTEDLAANILQYLKEHQGFMEINDKTAAEIIYQTFGVSRKKFKIALGGLYKKRVISVDEDGTRLIKAGS